MTAYYVSTIANFNSTEATEDVARTLDQMKEDAEFRFAWDSEIEAVEYARQNDDYSFDTTRIYRDGTIETEHEEA